MTFQQLQYILALEEAGNFTVAAKACSVTQPTLSAQIKKLEDEWGTALFDRSRHPIRPTPTGERVAAEARAALDRLAALAEGVKRNRSDLGGTLEIGIIPTVAPFLLPRLMVRLGEKHPRITLKVNEALTGEIADRVQRGRWDVGLVSTPTGLGGLEEKPLYRERFLAYLSPGHPLLSTESVPLGWLNETPLFLLKEGHCFRDQVVSLCGPRPTTAGMESGSLDTLLRLVEAGLGNTLIPEGWRFDLDEDRRALVRPLEGEPSRAIGAILQRDAPKAALAAAFLETIPEVVPRGWRLTPP